MTTLRDGSALATSKPHMYYRRDSRDWICIHWTGCAVGQSPRAAYLKWRSLCWMES